MPTSYVIKGSAILKSSLKLILMYFHRINKQEKAIKKVLINLIICMVYILILSFIFQHISYIHTYTSAYDYADYDVSITGFTDYQAEKIKKYDFVDRFVGLNYIYEATFTKEDLKSSTNLYVVREDSLKDIKYTPFCSKLLISKDDDIIADSLSNPILIYKRVADELKAKVGDKITLQVSDRQIIYTVAGIYEPAVDITMYASIVIYQGDIKDWITQVVCKGLPVDYESAYIKFNDKAKGKEMLDNYIKDSDLYMVYGEDYLNKATTEQLNIAKDGAYEYRQISYEKSLKYLGEDYLYIIALICLGSIALVAFVIREETKLIALSQRSIAILVANGCRIRSFFIYFLCKTFLKQIMFIAISLPIVKLCIVENMRDGFYLPWYLILEYTPYILGIVLISSLIVSTIISINFSRGLSRFMGEYE